MEDQYPTDPLSLITEAEDRYKTLVATEFALNYEVAIVALQLASAKMMYAQQLVSPPRFRIVGTPDGEEHEIPSNQEA